MIIAATQGDFLAPRLSAQSIPLSSGDTGTAQTISEMRRLVDQGIKNPQINRLAVQIVRDSPQFQQLPKAQAVFAWMQENLRFVGNMVGKQTLRTPAETLQVGGGSCADFTVLAATLLGTIGIRSHAVTIASHEDEPDEFSHVYPEAFADGQWIALDIARPGATFGRTPETYFRKRVWDLFGSQSREVSGLNGYGFLGRMRRPLGCSSCKRSALGQDDGSGWTSVFTPQDISAITSGTANIIAASRATPSNITAYSIPSPSGNPALMTPSGALIPGGAGEIGGISSGTLLLLLLGVGVAIAVSR